MMMIMALVTMMMMSLKSQVLLRTMMTMPTIVIKSGPRMLMIMVMMRMTMATIMIKSVPSLKSQVWSL